MGPRLSRFLCENFMRECGNIVVKASRSNDFFSTGTVKFLNIVHDAIVLFFQLIKKFYLLRLLRIT